MLARRGSKFTCAQTHPSCLPATPLLSQSVGVDTHSLLAEVSTPYCMQPNVWNPAAPQHGAGVGAPSFGQPDNAFPTFGGDSTMYAAAAQPMLSMGAHMGRAAIGHYRT